MDTCRRPSLAPPLAEAVWASLCALHPDLSVVRVQLDSDASSMLLPDRHVDRVRGELRGALVELALAELDLGTSIAPQLLVWLWLFELVGIAMRAFCQDASKVGETYVFMRHWHTAVCAFWAQPRTAAPHGLAEVPPAAGLADCAR